jgi:uncharacterized membrane protein YdjX (TVP38/TMEM64 family)
MLLKEKLKKYKYDIFIAVVIVALVLLFALLKNQFGFLSDRENFQEYIKSFGALAPVVIILVITLEVIIAPLPGFIPAISSGFIFGPVEGTIYALVGNIIGSTLAFLLARRLGKIIVLRLVSEAKLDKYEEAVRRRKNILFAMYFFPIFPVDILSFAFGMSDIKYKKFITIVSIGFVSHMLILNYFGDYLAKLYF